MKSLLTLVLAIALVSAAIAEPTSRLRKGGDPGSVRVANPGDASAEKVYIVQLAKPSATEHFKTSVLKSGQPFSKSASGVRQYAQVLQREQDALIARIVPGAEKIYSYRFGLNGFAAKMTALQADKLSARPEVLNVWEDEVRPLATNFSEEFLDLFNGDNGLRGPEGLTGEDIVIGFIDSGIYPEHPQLRDTREAPRPSACRSSWGRNSLLGRWLCGRYEDQDDIVDYQPPVDWDGECESGEAFAATDCNAKLIGARFFIEGAEATGPIDAGEIRSARDVDGHGTHTATTAAGNRENASLYGSFVGTIQGIAPRARVAVYKACWLRPGATRASCNTSDLANAIDSAVADGVDIINYSVSSTFLQVTAPDDIALANAAKAGVVPVVAAGNDGPNFASIGSPAGSPWVITVGASTRSGETSVEAIQIDAPANLAGRYVVKEANFTPALADNDPIEAQLILVDDGDETLASGGAGTLRDGCEPLINDGDIFGNIAFIERGGCDFDVKIANASDAGAVAALVYSVAGDAIVMNGNASLVDIPALMIGQADGNLILAELEQDIVVDVVLDKGLLLTEPETGNRMAVFSGRGPGPVPAILKPDVTAPGVNILAGISPVAANAMQGETYGYLSGTSMSTPHVAGIAALLLEKHPEWTPDIMRSALMTTARQDIVKGDFESPADPFDFGAGHIVPNLAATPSLVYRSSDDEYDAFACGAESPGVSEARCTELADLGQSFAPENINQPSIAIARLANERVVSRRVTNISDEAQTFSASLETPPGLEVRVNPTSLTLGPGESASFDVTTRYLSGPLDFWRFGSLSWTSPDTSVRIPYAARPVSLTAPAEVVSFGGTGSQPFDVEFGYTGAYSAQVHGLNLPLVLNGFVDNDPTKTFDFRADNGVQINLIEVPPAQLYLRFALFDALTDGNDDLDMYVYYCADGVNCNRIGESGGPTSQERFDIFRPAGGVYAVLIHGFETDEVQGGPGANYSLLSWSFGLVEDQGNMTVSAPSFVAAGTSETLTIDWTNLATDTIYLGGISHNTPNGLVGVTVVTIVN